MKFKTLNIVTGMAAAAILFSSCLVTKPYSRPGQMVSDKLYRMDEVKKDSSNFSDLDWRQLFTDPVLQGYIHHALDSNFDMQVALQNLRIAATNIKQARAGYIPTLSANGSTTYQTQSVNTQFGQIIGQRRHIVQYELSGSLSWEADIWGKITSQKKAAQAAYLSTSEARRAIQSQLVAAMANAYYQLLAFDEQKKILQEGIDLRKSTLETSKALKLAGTLTEVAVKQAEAQVFNAQAQLVSLESSIRILENAISVLMAQDPQYIKRSVLNQQVVKTQLAVGVPYQLLTNRPDVLAAEYDFVNAFELSNVAKASMYPALRLTAGGGLQSVDFDKLFSINSLFASVIGSLTQPLWNQRQLRSNKERALATQQIAYVNYRRAVLIAGQEVSDALFTYQTQDQLYTLKRNEYQALDTATQYSRELVNYGLANYLEVLTAQQNVLSAQLSMVNASYGRLSAIVDLYRALGGGK